MMEWRELKEAFRFMGSFEFWRMGIFWTFSLLFSYFQLIFVRTSVPASHHRRQKPLCIITGATSGLGQAAAYALSGKGFYVVLVGRSSQSLSKTIEGIKRQNKDAHLKAFEVDLSSFSSILKFKDSLQEWLLESDMHSSIQLLINNAGILATSSRVTADGFDQMMGTNYVGTFCLTKMLLPLLRNCPDGSRVVNLTSFTHRNVFNIQVDKETVSGKCFCGLTQYPYARIYEFSKLCLVLFSYQLHRQLHSMDNSSQVSVVAADPGVVKTHIMREVPSCLSHLAFFVLKLLGLLQSPENGVNSILDAALAPPEKSGVYYFGGKGRTVNSSALSCSTELANQLWTTSNDLFLELKLASREIPHDDGN